MIVDVILGSLTGLSLLLLIWQWWAARRFPLHQRIAHPGFSPAVTLLKPLKGCDPSTESCLRSWFTQVYSGQVQILFGVADVSDPVCEVVRKLMVEFPQSDAQLIVCSDMKGVNAKVAKLATLEPLAKHEIFIVSDADVRVPADFLQNVVAPFAPKPGRDSQVGLVNCFYRLANPSTLAMQWEAVAINADFWSQVLQSRSLKPLDFALGAVMATGRNHVREIGGFQSLADCLADDYQLGNRIARNGYSIALCPVVVDCWDPPHGWRAVWKHQLRWARTIRVCQPVPYFFSILSNAGVWSMLWFIAACMGISMDFDSGHEMMTLMVDVPVWKVLASAGCLLTRVVLASDLQRRLTGSSKAFVFAWMVPIKDLLQVAVWFLAFAGNDIEWRGQRYRLAADGTMHSLAEPEN